MHVVSMVTQCNELPILHNMSDYMNDISMHDVPKEIRSGQRSEAEQTDHQKWFFF
jgi:hypothetical protein